MDNYVATYVVEGMYKIYSNNTTHPVPHRLDGPAVEFSSGCNIWYVNGERINCSTQEEFERILKLKTFW